MQPNISESMTAVPTTVSPVAQVESLSPESIPGGLDLDEPHELVRVDQFVFRDNLYTVPSFRVHMGPRNAAFSRFWKQTGPLLEYLGQTVARFFAKSDPRVRLEYYNESQVGDLHWRDEVKARGARTRERVRALVIKEARELRVGAVLATAHETLNESPV